MIYIHIFLIFLGIYLGLRWLRQHQAKATRDASRDAGLTQPASLHPVINPGLCIGCGSCVKACPERQVLGLINGKAELVKPTYCIGHGACQSACPMGAITLVFGTEARGVDIPTVKPDFETNIPGIFIAGELGGMGLIRNAIEQGRQAMESIRKLENKGENKQLDVVIVGAGPAGLAASLTALQHKMRFVTLEQDSLGGTVSHYPRGKVVMTAPVEVPLLGKMRFTETTKEKLIEFWTDAVTKTGLKVNFRERVESITRNDSGFVVKTQLDSYKVHAVLLAIGRRGTPRKLRIPGENIPKVVYRMIDSEQYQHQKVLVVGGGDSALEAAIAIAEEPGTEVTLSYRNDAFSRAKEKNRDALNTLADQGEIKILMKSNVKEITDNGVRIEQGETIHEIENSAVIVCAGGILPTPFLKSMGIEVETKYGTL